MWQRDRHPLKRTLGGEAENGDKTWEMLVRTLTDQLQWFCLQHETEEFLIRFGFEDDGFSVEIFIKQHFIWWEASKARIPKHEAVVHISDAANEQVVIGKDLLEVD